MKYPSNAVLMLVAPWCAPCYGELARIEEIAAAAKPKSVRVLMIDDGPAARAMVRGIDPSRIWGLSTQRMRPVRQALLARTPGLPYSVATDGDGLVCATYGGGLNAVTTRALVERCSKPE